MIERYGGRLVAEGLSEADIRAMLDHARAAEQLQARQPLMQIIQSAWVSQYYMTHFYPIGDYASYQRAIELMNAILDVTGDNDDHPLSGALNLLSDEVLQYEKAAAQGSFKIIT